ncbi:MAG: hypothetical protein JW737_08215, partial [Acidobacteria bacterium]|nr:hypothetical protein [Acidobacteriota bacterium]
ESLEKIADAEVLTDRIEYWPHMEDNPVFSENAIVCLNLYDEIEKRSRYSTSTYIKNIGKDNVIKALKDKDFIIRRNTVKALTPDTARNFEKELYLLGVDDSWRVIFHALPLIASFKNEIAYKIIDRQLHNRRDNIRKKALESAVIHGSKKFYDNFLEGLKNTDTDIREASIEGLYNISNNAAIPNLKKAFAVESDQFLKFCIIRSLVKLGYKTQSERESIYYKICSGTLMKEDLENTETIKTFLLFYNSMRSYSDEQNSWIDKSLESISKLYSENKELGLYIAEHYTEFSEYEINVICFFYLRDYSINAAIPIMIKRFVSTKQPYYYFSNARFNLSQIAGIPESEVTKIVKIWPEVLKQAKTPDDYPVLIKTMLKKKKEK